MVIGVCTLRMESSFKKTFSLKLCIHSSILIKIKNNEPILLLIPNQIDKHLIMNLLQDFTITLMLPIEIIDNNLNHNCLLVEIKIILVMTK